MLAGIGLGGHQLALRGQRRLIQVRLGARDCVVVEAGESCGDRVDLRIELFVRDDPVDVPVLLCAWPVDVVRDEQDLEYAAAADQPGESCHRAAPGHARRDLVLATQRALAGGESQVAGGHELAAGASARPRIEAMMNTGARDWRTRRSSHSCVPVKLTPGVRSGPGSGLVS